MIAKGFTEPTERIKRLKKAFVAAVPEVESERAVLVTESYRETEGMPILIRRAKALERILNHLPIVIRDDELVVGVITKNLRSAQIYRSFRSNGWKKSSIPWIREAPILLRSAKLQKVS